MPDPTVEQILETAIGHHRAGRFAQAETVCQGLLGQWPDHPEALHLLGVVSRQLGDTEKSIALINRAISLKPDWPQAYNSLGNAHAECGQFDDAAAAFRHAILLRPSSAALHTNLGNVLREIGDLELAIAEYRLAIWFNANLPEAHSNLGLTLKETGQLDEAIDQCQRAVELQPDDASSQANLGNALLLAGQLDQALIANRKAISLEPVNPIWQSNLIFSLNYYPQLGASDITAELSDWNHRHAEPLSRSWLAHTNNPDPDRRLRIGYVSADFRQHAVARFLEPLLANHDRSRFEIFAYAQVPVADELTLRLRSQVDHWRNTVPMSDAKLTDVIREDGIDILVDLGLHTVPNRLLVFARKPAPVQITWLGYPGSTGLKAMDYRISDPYLDPPGPDETVYSEKTLRLPETYWCYRPSPEAGEIAPLPARQRGYVTFGCLNQFAKMNSHLLKSWIKILLELPGSVLLLQAPAGRSRQRVIDQFEKAGVNPQRLQFEPRAALREYFRLYDRIDIALDTSPFAGGTTTCDALWMGVPVVTLKGATVTARGGSSVVSNAGFPELVAHSVEGYITIAVELARDLSRLENLRRVLRQTMKGSNLSAEARFADNLESAYRFAWKQWGGSGLSTVASPK